jgi:hypothetical protein
MGSLRNFGLIASVVLLAPIAARAGILVTLEGPDVQKTQVAGALTETFDTHSLGKFTSYTSSIGTYTSPNFAIVRPDSYGGSFNTQYFAIGAQSATQEATLSLNSPQAYFGFDWLAGDAKNVLSFYSGQSLLGSFGTADVFTSGVLTPAYFGKPGSRNQDSGEPFGYLNFYGTGGTTFDRIVFSNLSLGTGFESDNHSVYGSQIEPPYSGTPVGSINAVPEPATLASAGIAIGVGVLAYRRKRRAE